MISQNPILKKMFLFLKSLFSKILILCNERGGEYIHRNSYLYVVQCFAVSSSVLRFLVMNILLDTNRKSLNVSCKGILITDVQVLFRID